MKNPPEGFETIDRKTVKAPEWFAAGGLFFRSVEDKYQGTNREKAAICRSCKDKKIRATKLRNHVDECHCLAADLKAQFNEDMLKARKVRCY